MPNRSEKRPGFRALWVLLAVVLAACSSRVIVRPDVILPAQIPVRSFPAVWVAGGTQPLEAQLLDRVAQHIATDATTEVRRVDLSDLEPAREAGAIPAATVVLALDLRFEEASRSYVGQQPVQYCGIAGCWVTYANYVGTSQAVVGKTKATVYDGPTARVLQEREFRAEVAGNDVSSMRASVLDSLVGQVTQAVDMLRTQVRIPLARVNVPGLREALVLMKAGRYAEARAQLETLAHSLGGYSGRKQSAVWYDLGVARWFSRGDAGLDAQTYADAKRAFEWAERAEAGRGAQQALRELELDYQRQQVRVQQEQARAYNFTLVTPPAPGAQKPNGGPSAPALAPSPRAPIPVPPI